MLAAELDGGAELGLVWQRSEGAASSATICWASGLPGSSGLLMGSGGAAPGASEAPAGEAELSSFRLGREAEEAEEAEEDETEAGRRLPCGANGRSGKGHGGRESGR